MGEIPKQYEHEFCISGRPEYCVDDEGIALGVYMATDLIHQLLNEGPDSVLGISNRLKKITTSSVIMTNRTMIFPPGNNEEGIDSNLERRICARHIEKRDIKCGVDYEIETGWRVKGKEGDWIDTSYRFRLLSDGDIRATITSIDLVFGGYKRQAMTPYDFKGLFDEIGSILAG
jgi:hypothetical protein